MSTKIKLNKTDLKIVKDDLTAMEVDAFVFYAREDLSLGSGYGNAISTRGGPKIKEELDKIGKTGMSQAVITSAGMLSAKHIIHAVGPAFQEEEIEPKLQKAIENSLACAESNDISTLAFPIMGAGFYGIDPNKSVSIMYDAVKKHCSKNSKLKEIIFCAADNRELGFITNNVK